MSNPEPSATPAPIMAMKTTAMTPKFWKFATNEVKMKRIPSMVNRLLTGMVSSRIVN